MNTDDILKSGIGNLDKKSNALKPAKVTITEILVKDKKNNGETMDTPLIEFMVKHPDNEELIKLSKVKQLINDKVSCNSTWLTFDAEDNIQKDMPLSRLMNFLNVKTLDELKGKEIDTLEESETVHFLALKAY
jgi:hypothetical protein